MTSAEIQDVIKTINKIGHLLNEAYQIAQSGLLKDTNRFANGYLAPASARLQKLTETLKEMDAKA